MWLVFDLPSGVNSALPYVGVFLLAIALASTMFLSVPLHKKMALAPTADIGHKLVCTNWPRTVAWTQRGVLMACMLMQATCTRVYRAECPVPVKRAVMVQKWENLVYLHWTYEREQVQSLLPEGLLVDTFEGKAYVGLIPFQMRGIGVPHLPAVPY